MGRRIEEENTQYICQSAETPETLEPKTAVDTSVDIPEPVMETEAITVHIGPKPGKDEEDDRPVFTANVEKITSISRCVEKYGEDTVLSLFKTKLTSLVFSAGSSSFKKDEDINKAVTIMLERFDKPIQRKRGKSTDAILAELKVQGIDVDNEAVKAAVLATLANK